MNLGDPWGAVEVQPVGHTVPYFNHSLIYSTAAQALAYSHFLSILLLYSKLI